MSEGEFRPELTERRKRRADGDGERWVRGEGEGREEGGCWLSCPAGAGAHSNKMEITAAPEPLSAASVASSPSAAASLRSVESGDSENTDLVMISEHQSEESVIQATIIEFTPTGPFIRRLSNCSAEHIVVTQCVSAC